MRLNEPRLAPLSDAQMSDEQRAIADTMAGRPTQTTPRLLNVFRTVVRVPELAKPFLAYGAYILDRRRSLDPRTRELLVLRTGWLCRSGYEWAQHVPLGQRAGLSDSDIEAIKAGPDHPRWAREDALLLRAADELHRDQFITEPTWQALADILTEKQRVDLVMTVGQYTQVCMFLNTMGVPLDPGQTLDDDLDFRPR